VSGQIELAQNALGRSVPTMVNGKPQIPFLGVGKFQPHGRKAAPPISSNKDYPDTGDKRVADFETALRNCGLRDGMVISKPSTICATATRSRSWRLKRLRESASRI
jgi:citrate lyase subunit alpha / citrate CoA-transferase